LFTTKSHLSLSVLQIHFVDIHMRVSRALVKR